MKNQLTLGIARIGDLLLNNCITQIDGEKEISDIILKIPEYQRPYKWTGKNVNQLFDDILLAKSENREVYRVGTLILHHDNENNYNIVDGQQRTISFALLLHALGEKSIPLFQQSLTDNPYNAHNIPNNYRAFERRLKRFKDDERKNLREYVENNCELIVVITSNLSEAFQFFDSQNARGKKLYPHDLLKAYHLREMNNLGVDLIEETVKAWEEMNQSDLSELFAEYLYRLKAWINGNKAVELNEHNIEIFKGVSATDNFPYAQYYKGAYAYADNLNNSMTPYVTGLRKLRPFQINTPIVAGKPFFDYAKHYFDILADIQNNDRYEGYLINDNEIVKTLNLREYRNGVGNRITRLLFDTSILLYTDRFCPDIPSKKDLELLDQFVVFAFVWAYSMRAQYFNVGWLVAQNYIMGTCGKESIINSFNIYKTIAAADSPMSLISALSDKIMPLPSDKTVAQKEDVDKQDEENVYLNYLHFFKTNGFWSEKQ